MTFLGNVISIGTKCVLAFSGVEERCVWIDMLSEDCRACSFQQSLSKLIAQPITTLSYD